MEKVSIPKTGKRIDNLGSQWELKPIYKRSSVNYKSAKSHLSKGKIRCRWGNWWIVISKKRLSHVLEIKKADGTKDIL